MGPEAWIAIIGLVLTVLLVPSVGALVWSVRTMERITSRLEVLERRDDEHDARLSRIERKVFNVPALAASDG